MVFKFLSITIVVGPLKTGIRRLAHSAAMEDLAAWHEAQAAKAERNYEVMSDYTFIKYAHWHRLAAKDIRAGAVETP